MFNFKKKFSIAGKKIYNFGEPYIIAEIGSNYDQSLSKIIKYINLSKKLGAHCVKFQLFKASDLLEKNNKNFKIFQQNELPVKWLKKISKFCKKKNIDFLCSPFSIQAVKSLKEIHICAYKIASSEILNFDLLNEIAKQKKPIILSSGMANLEDVILSLNYLKKKKCRKIALLQCTSNYPTDIIDLNLNVINTYKKLFNDIPVGLSDHSSSTISPALAVAKGSCIIEKHLTLNNKNTGPDHSYAMNPKEFRIMIENIKIAQKCNGSFNKKMHLLEKKYGRKKGIYYLKNFKKQHLVTFKDICVKNFKQGIQAKKIELIINRKLLKNVKKNEPVKKGDFFNEKKK